MAKKNTQAPAAAEVAAAPAAEATAPVAEAPEVTTAPEAETAQAPQDAAAEVAAAPAADGTVQLRGSNCSVDGCDYLAEDGIVIVLAAHAEVLIRDFGFERV